MATERFSGYSTATADQERPRCANRSVTAHRSETGFATFLSQMWVIIVIGGQTCFSFC